MKHTGSIPDDIAAGPEIMQSWVNRCVKGILNLKSQNKSLFPGTVKGVHLVAADDIDVILHQRVMRIFNKQIHFPIKNYTDLHIIVAMRRA